MRLGIGIRLGPMNRAAAALPSAPALAFADGSQGAWFDPSDLSSMWQDSTKTTTAAVNSPVGAINDKSGRGNHATQATAAARPILRQVGSLFHLEFDGVDDFLATAATFEGADASGFAAQIASVSFSTLTTIGQVMILRGATRPYHFRKNLAALESVYVDSTGVVTVDVGPSVIAAEKLVMTATLGAGGVLEMKKNRVGNGATTVAAALQAGIARTLYVGGSIAAGEFMAGNFYGGVWLSRSPTGTELADIESYLAAKAGVTL